MVEILVACFTPTISTVDRTVTNGPAFKGTLTRLLGVLGAVFFGVVLASITSRDRGKQGGEGVSVLAVRIGGVGSL